MLNMLGKTSQLIGLNTIHFKICSPTVMRRFLSDKLVPDYLRVTVGGHPDDTFHCGKWEFKEGERVSKGDILVRVNTPTMIIYVKSPSWGILEQIHVLPESIIPYGEPICTIRRSIQHNTVLYQENGKNHNIIYRFFNAKLNNPSDFMIHTIIIVNVILIIYTVLLIIE